MRRSLCFLPVVLVYLSHLGQLQMQPDWLLEHPGQPWQLSLVGLAALRTLPWALLAVGMYRHQLGESWAAASLGLALWASGFPQDFEASSWTLAALHGLVLLIWLGRADYRMLLVAGLFLPWRATPDGQALLALAVWKLSPKGSPWRPLLALQMLLRILGIPGPAWEWAALAGWVLTGRKPAYAWMVLVLGLFLWERNINKSLLIPLQESHMSLSALVWPADFGQWAERRGRAFGVTPEVRQLVDRIVARSEPALWNWPRPPLRLQPLQTRALVERWSGRPDLARRANGGESWISHNLSRGTCNLTVLPVAEEDRPAPMAADVSPGSLQWRPEQPIGPGSWVEVEITGSPATLVEDRLSLRLPPGRHRLQLPLDNTEVVVQGVAQHRLNLDEALQGLDLVSAQAPPGLSSNSLTAVELTLSLHSQQSLWVPYVAAQLCRPDLPQGLRQTSPLTPVDVGIKPGQSVKIPCFLEVPEMGTGFECEFYWVAPLRRAYRLGSARFACRPRFPAKDL